MTMQLPELPNRGRYTGYWRVSTEDQNPDMQIEAMVAAGVPRERIRGDKMTGSKMNRPGLASALRITRGDDVIVVWKLDRLGRSTLGVLDTIKTLEDKKIGLISLTEMLDTKSPMGRMVIKILVAFAEMERDLISERTKAGMARFKAQGGRTGPRHSIRDCPKRLAVLEDLMRSGKYKPGAEDTMTDGQVVKILNAVKGSKLPPMKSSNSLTNWRKGNAKKDIPPWKDWTPPGETIEEEGE